MAPVSYSLINYSYSLQSCWFFWFHLMNLCFVCAKELKCSIFEAGFVLVLDEKKILVHQVVALAALNCEANFKFEVCLHNLLICYSKIDYTWWFACKTKKKGLTVLCWTDSGIKLLFYFVGGLFNSSFFSPANTRHCGQEFFMCNPDSPISYLVSWKYSYLSWTRS